MFSMALITFFLPKCKEDLEDSDLFYERTLFLLVRSLYELFPISAALSDFRVSNDLKLLVGN